MTRLEFFGLLFELARGARTPSSVPAVAGHGLVGLLRAKAELRTVSSPPERDIQDASPLLDNQAASISIFKALWLAANEAV